MAEILMEKRESLMVSPKGGNPTKKITYFIKPILNSDELNPELPSISLPLKPISLKCTFNGWRTPTHDWISWVDRLHSSYKFIWKRVGIYDAILSSRYNIIKNEDLIFGLAERWCCDTNTFVFPWGEASVTLEDVFVLGGYSVLGDNNVSKSNLNKDFDKIVEKLEDVHQKLSRGPSNKANQSSWMKYFMKDGGESGIEHEAFLVFWLCRFVLPSFPYDTIVKKFFKIAIGLARGVQIALAPLVLASIYRDLSLLKSTMANSDSFDDLVVLTLWAPLQFVQVWAWERFPVFRPKPGLIECGEPRLARWNGVSKKEIGNVRALLEFFFFENDFFLENCEHRFEWRPYCKDDVNIYFPCFYKETEQVVIVEDGLDDDIRSLVRILKISQLLGMDTIEQYNPHRVAMQFGYDLDIPKYIGKGLMGSDIPRREQMQLAWISYTNSIRDEILYVPSKIYEPQVTMRYLKCLRQGVLSRAAAFDGVLRKKRLLKRSRRSYEHGNLRNASIIKSSTPPDIDLKPSFRSKIVGKDLDMPSIFLPKYVSPDVKIGPPECTLKTNVGHYTDVPPGFMPKTDVHRLDFPPGFCQISNSVGKEADVSPRVATKSNFGRVMNAPPGFVPKIIVHNSDVPAGSFQKSSVTCNDAVSPLVNTPNGNVARIIDAPPGFVPKTTPPGFTPNLSQPTKSCVQKKDMRASESKVTVKIEHIESTEKSKLLKIYGNDQSSIADIMPKEEVLSRATERQSSGRCEQVAEKIVNGNDGSVGGTAENVAHRIEANAERGSHTGTSSDLAARIRKMFKMVVERTQAN